MRSPKSESGDLQAAQSGTMQSAGSATARLRIERRVDLGFEFANLTLQFVDAGAGGTAFGIQCLGFRAGDLLPFLRLGLLLTLNVQVGLQATELFLLRGNLALGTLFLGFQTDALQFQIRHRSGLLGEVAVQAFGRGFIGGLDNAPQVFLLEQRDVVRQVTLGKQQAGAVGPVIGGAQL